MRSACYVYGTAVWRWWARSCMKSYLGMHLRPLQGLRHILERMFVIPYDDKYNDYIEAPKIKQR